MFERVLQNYHSFLKKTAKALGNYLVRSLSQILKTPKIALRYVTLLFTKALINYPDPWLGNPRLVLTFISV